LLLTMLEDADPAPVVAVWTVGHLVQCASRTAPT
jgi:hypothetical protein